MKQFTPFALILVVCCLRGLAQDGGTETRPYLYQEDFEQADPSKPFHSVACTVNFKGLSDEGAHAGEKCLKIDVTFGEKGHAAWIVPVPVPAEGALAFRGQIRVGKESKGTGTALLAVRIRCEPAVSTGVDEMQQSIGPNATDWIFVEDDLVARARKTVKWLMGTHHWQSKLDNVGVFITGIVIQLKGNPGDRVVIYVDDFRIEGRAPAADAYQQEIERRWAPIAQQVERKLNAWDAALDSLDEEIRTITAADPEAQGKIETATAALQALREDVRKIREKRHIRKTDLTRVQAGVGDLAIAVRNIGARSKSSQGVLKNARCYVVAPTRGVMILPDTDPVPGVLSQTVSLTAAPGEYEPASFVLRAFADLNGVTLAHSDLVSENGSIPAATIDIKIIKCWYQAEGAWYWKSRKGPGKVLVPELMLNDDTVVKVDTVKKANYLKLRFPDGDKYVAIDHPEDYPVGMGAVIRYKIKDFPVSDSATLLPVDIPQGTNKQFWITVHVPDDAVPGDYVGTIGLSAANGAVGELTVNLRVLPFRLALPGARYDPAQPFTPLMYYHGRLWRDPARMGNIDSDAKSETQLRQDLENLFAHGVTSPSMEQPFDDRDLFAKYLRIRNEVGMSGQPLYMIGIQSRSPQAEDELNELKTHVRAAVEFTKAYGVPELYVYGLDEAVGEKMKAQRLAWQAVHEAGAKIWVAAMTGTFEAMGDLLDIYNHGADRSGPDPAEPAKWHGAGYKIWNYGNPQGGVENPELYRRNYGLLLWQLNYDGGGPWAWQSSSFGGMWDDFNDDRRGVAMTYPTADGMIDTIAWEGFREGVDDVRYATTLTLQIAAAMAGKDPERTRVAGEAQQYLNEFEVSGDLDEIRSSIIGYILKLRGVE